MPVSGKMEVTVKFTQFPADAQPVGKDRKEIRLLCDGREVRIALGPKAFARLEQARAQWPYWMGVIAGQMGPATPKGFVLLEPKVQVFERKPKAPAPAAEPKAPPGE
jgi:hypothetical protein